MTNTTSSSSTQQPNQNQPIHPYLTLLTQQSQSKPNTAYIHSIILKAISDPSVNVGYNEISALPIIKSTLQGSITGQSLLNTLNLFSHEPICSEMVQEWLNEQHS